MMYLGKQLAKREEVRDHYWSHDPINPLRLHWRACTFRHLVHLLPGETILEIGAGAGRYTKELSLVSRGENPITAVCFRQCEHPELPQVTWVDGTDFQSTFQGKYFDYIVAHQLLDAELCSELLSFVRDHLNPGGKFVFVESNPWNPIRKIRCLISQWFPLLARGDESRLLNPLQFHQLLSELGFIRIGAMCEDFLYPPVFRSLIPLLRNVSLILENTPLIRNLAGSLLLTGQVPPRDVPRPSVSLATHQELFGKVSIVVPCHNEEMNIVPLVEGLRAHYDKYIGQFVLVNDNSKDQTQSVMEELQRIDPRITIVKRTPPGGVGFALQDGIAAATCPVVLTMDCDFTHILPELRDMFEVFATEQSVDAVFGSRFSRESVLINYPLSKILCNRGFHILLSLLFRKRIRDMTNNLKLMRKDMADNLRLTQQHFSINAEIALQLILMGYNCRQVPISWINRTPEMGKSSFRLFQVGFNYVKVLLQLWWDTRFGFRKLPRVQTTTAITAATFITDIQ